MTGDVRLFEDMRPSDRTVFQCLVRNTSTVFDALTAQAVVILPAALVGVCSCILAESSETWPLQ